MWIIVMFDLPTITKENRYNYSTFKKTLEQLGFIRMQFSVYMKSVGSRERLESQIRQVQRNLPPEGQVSILNFTDKQFEQIKHFYCRAQRKSPSAPQQLQMF